MKKLRWGILSTANIARKNWAAILNSGNSIVTAVASRDMEKSRKFITRCQSQTPFETAPTALGSYEELIASPDVDAVYIPLPTALRKEWVIRAAQAGKHILCEKPCAVNTAALEEMLAACRKNRVQFLDGVMFMHNERLKKIRATLDDGESIGQIKRIVSNFSFCGHEQFLSANIRANAALEPLGCLGDLGWYCIRFALWTMNWQTPREVSARLLAQTAEGVPLDFSAELLFDGGVSASLYCSFVNFRQQWINVSGTKGYLQLDDFVNPFYGNETHFRVTNIGQRDFDVLPDVRPIAATEHGNHHPTAQESVMFRNFAAQVLSGKLNDDWPMWALKTQQVMDACVDAARKSTKKIS